MGKGLNSGWVPVASGWIPGLLAGGQPDLQPNFRHDLGPEGTGKPGGPPGSLRRKDDRPK